MRIYPVRSAWAIIFAALLAFVSYAADWPQWAGGPTRNPVSLEKGLPLDFRFEETEGGRVVKAERGIAWKAKLGFRTVVPPVIADGFVWVCTNIDYPEDEKLEHEDWDGGVLLCFRESDGKPLWKHRTPKLSDKNVVWQDLWPQDFPGSTLGSVPLVEGDRLWYVNNRSEVVCFDIGPLKKGIGEPRQLWKLDMRKQLGVYSRLPLMQGGFAASVASYKDHLYVVTHNAVNDSHTSVAAPEAPSFICIDKATGKLVWKDNSPGKNILDVQISSPLVAEIKGKVQAIVGQGDGWLRSFDALTGKLIWECDLDSKHSVYRLGWGGERNYIVATPVLYEDRIYIATGQETERGAGPGTLYCIDPTKTGDVSRELGDGLNKGKPNPNSAVVWFTPNAVPEDAPRIEVGTKKKRDLLRSRSFYFGRSVGGCVVHDGLVYAADLDGRVFCFDAKTGKLYWVADVCQEIRGQLLWVDGKVLVTNSDGDLWVFAHGKEKKQLAKIECSGPFFAGPVFANGTLYLTTETTLYAIRKTK